jgi:tRNA-specific 2-thiouridylase
MHAGQRMAVVALDATTRRVLVGPREVGTTQIQLRDVNWLVDSPADGFDCAVRLRSKDQFRPARIAASGSTARVTLATPALPAPGQACVFYDGSRVLGGGFIRS